MEVIKLRSQFSLVLGQVTVHLQEAQHTLFEFGRSIEDKARKLREEVRARQNELRRLVASSFDAIVVTNAEITRQLSIALGQTLIHLQQAQNTLTGLARTVADKPRRLREEVRARENELRRLLASSFDAIVVTDVDRRLVAANPIALRLLGVSEANMRKFTIDVFLSRGQISYFHANGSSFIGREERHGECKIRCLDGSLRAAEYTFVANFVPFRHLCRFCNGREWPPRKRVTAERKMRYWSHY
jgi:PAS domain S-box-containing protein